MGEIKGAHVFHVAGGAGKRILCDYVALMVWRLMAALAGGIGGRMAEVPCLFMTQLTSLCKKCMD